MVNNPLKTLMTSNPLKTLMTNKPLLGLCLFGIMSLAQALEVNDFSHAFPLTIDEKSPAYRIELPLEVYQHLAPEAHREDIVVINADNHEVPSGLITANNKSSQQPWEATLALFTIPPDPQKTDEPSKQDASPSRWLVDAGKAVSLEQLELLLPVSLGNTHLTLALDSSGDLQHWQTLNSHTTITRLGAANNHVEQTRIAPTFENTDPARYYRLRLLEGQPSWSITNPPDVHLQGHSQKKNDAWRAAIRWQELPVPNTSSSGRDFTFSLPARLPVVALRLRLADTNSAADLQVYSNDTSAAPLATARMVQLESDHHATTLTIPTTFLSTLKVRASTSLDNAPSVMVGWQPDTLAFLAQGPAPYRLLAGSNQQRRIDSPINAAIAKITHGSNHRERLPLASVGDAQLAGGSAALEPASTFNPTKLLLWLTLIIACLLASGLAMRLLLHNDKTS